MAGFQHAPGCAPHNRGEFRRNLKHFQPFLQQALITRLNPIFEVAAA
jgi:hypothetical protein